MLCCHVLQAFTIGEYLMDFRVNLDIATRSTNATTNITTTTREVRSFQGAAEPFRSAAACCVCLLRCCAPVGMEGLPARRPRCRHPRCDRSAASTQMRTSLSRMPGNKSQLSMRRSSTPLLVFDMYVPPPPIRCHPKHVQVLEVTPVQPFQRDSSRRVSAKLLGDLESYQQAGRGLWVCDCGWVHRGG